MYMYTYRDRSRSIAIDIVHVHAHALGQLAAGAEASTFNIISNSNSVRRQVHGHAAAGCLQKDVDCARAYACAFKRAYACAFNIVTLTCARSNCAAPPATWHGLSTYRCACIYEY